jgi:hypothetical protein
MAAAALAGQAAGAIFGVAGNLIEGEQKKAVDNYNASIAFDNANQTIAAGNEEARRSLVNSGKAIGGEQAAYSASGVASDGSALWVLRDSAAKGALDAMTIKRNAATKANNYFNEGMMDRQRGEQASAAGEWGAASSFLSFGSATANSYGKGG